MNHGHVEATHLNVLQGILRSLLNSYVNGLYLRRLARYGYPVVWRLSPYAVRRALLELSRNITPLREDAAIVEWLDRLEERMVDITSKPDLVLAEAIADGYRCLRSALSRRTDVIDDTLVEDAGAFDRRTYLELDKSYFRPVIALEQYCKVTLSAYLADAWIHGSVADLQVMKGYSDLDVLFVLTEKVATDPNLLREFARKCYRAHVFLYAFDHLQHHGFQVMTAIDWLAYPQSWLPLDSLSGGVSLLRQTERIKIRDSRFDAFEAFEKTVEDFILRSRRSWVPSNAYQFKYFLSVLMLLPTRFWQAQGDFCSKRVSFVKLLKLDAVLDDGILKTASAMRENWPHIRVPYGFRFLNPRVLTALCALQDKSILDMFSPTMVDEAASFALRLHEIVEGEVSRQLPCVGLPFSITNEPIPYTLTDYDIAREHYVKQAAGGEGVVAILEYGSLSEPGLSDLDFLVIVEDNSSISADVLSIHSLGLAQADLIMHEPVVIPSSIAAYLTEWLPYAKPAILYQHETSYICPAPISGEHEIYAHVARFLERLKNYHRDFLRAHQTQMIDARWSLAILKSLMYSISSAERITGKTFKTKDQYVIDLRALRATWLRDTERLRRMEQLRVLYQRGEELCDECLQAVTSWLRSEEWMVLEQIDDNTIALMRLCALYARESPLDKVLDVAPGPRPQTPFEDYLCWRASILAQQHTFLRANQLPFGSLL